MDTPTSASPVPLAIRNACMRGLADLVPDIVALAKESDSATVKLSAFDKLGKYGLSGRKTLLIENGLVLEVCLAKIAEIFSPPAEAFERFSQEVMAELALRAGGEFEDEEGDETARDST